MRTLFFQVVSAVSDNKKGISLQISAEANCYFLRLNGKWFCFSDNQKHLFVVNWQIIFFFEVNKSLHSLKEFQKHYGLKRLNLLLFIMARKFETFLAFQKVYPS